MSHKTMSVQLPLKINLRDDASFETFVAEQESIALVLSHLQQPDNARFAGCYYFYGASGVGKTHLLQAACRFYTQKQRQSVYFPLSNTALPLIPDVLNGLEITDLVCLDDVDKIIGQVAWERSLANFLAKSRVLGHRVLLTGSLDLIDWPVVSDELRRELLSIMPVHLSALQGSRELVLALQRHALYKGFDLPIEVGNFLLKRFSHNLEELLVVLGVLEQATLAEKRRLTLPFVKDVLAR
ncbi:HdaA/DnaA family protein [Thiomicrospira sp.]|uniref:HdaA/DnaA family protein n=1 Tax=Thiomicrospira sp. TaxID=935 RepID=UPI002F954572